jgi:hypothetical protein
MIILFVFIAIVILCKFIELTSKGCSNKYIGRDHDYYKEQCDCEDNF